MRRLRKPCEEHDRYEPHNWQKPDGDAACPGGEFLPEGALVIEKVDGEWPKSAIKAITGQLWERSGVVGVRNYTAVDILDALASQVGESE